MKRIALGVLFVAAFIAGASAQSAQLRPDFSGVWILKESSAPPGRQPIPHLNLGGITGGGPEMTVEQDDRTIKINRRFLSGVAGQPSSWTFMVTLDGSASSHSGPILHVNARPGLSRAVSSTAEWRGNDLVLLTTSAVTDLTAGPPNPVSLSVVIEMLALQGSTLLIERTPPADGVRIREIYVKKQERQ